MILLRMWSTAAPFPKGSSLPTVPGMGQAWWAALLSAFCNCRKPFDGQSWIRPNHCIKARHEKNQYVQGATVVQPILGDVAACAGVGLDFCLNSWHYFANYFNAIFITALNSKPKIFVTEEEDGCLVSSRTPKHSQVLPVLPPKFISEWIAPNSLCLSFFPALPLSLSWTSSRELSLCYHSGRWWTLTPSSSLMHACGPCSSWAAGENSPPPSQQQDQDTGLACACAWIHFRALQHRNRGSAGIEMVSWEDLKRY